MDDGSEDTRARRTLAKEQTDVEVPLRTSGAFSSPTNPRPKKLSQLSGRMPLPLLRGNCTGRDHSWGQNGDLSSAASASASAEECVKGTHSMSERPSKWGPWRPENVSSRQVQCAQPYRLQPANRDASSWADWTDEVRNSQPEYRARQPAALTPGTGLGTLILQDGKDQSGLLRLQGSYETDRDWLQSLACKYYEI